MRCKEDALGSLNYTNVLRPDQKVKNPRFFPGIVLTLTLGSGMIACAYVYANAFADALAFFPA